VARDLGHTFKFRGMDGQEYSLLPWPIPSVWLGTSVENQECADQRIPHLLKVPAAVRFLSCEPLLGPVNPTRLWLPDRSGWWNALDGRLTVKATTDAGQEFWAETEKSITGRINWVIVGGESGPGARPFELDWARSIQDQCDAAGVPLFVKQDSGRRPSQQGRIPLELWNRKEFPRGD
jgi:protein gp37